MWKRLRLNTMMNLSCKVITVLKGKTLATAESCTGGGIGAVLTAVPGSSSVYKGGVISYTNQIKEEILCVSREVLLHYGAVSMQVAGGMASGARRLLKTDVAVSVTGLAGPTGDDFGNSVGTVYIGYEDKQRAVVRKLLFSGTREDVRNQAIVAALELILEFN